MACMYFKIVEKNNFRFNRNGVDPNYFNKG